MSFYSKIVDHLNAAVSSKDAAEVRLTDLGAWCPPCYVPDMRYQPDGTLLFVR